MAKKTESKETAFKPLVWNLPFHNFNEEPKLIAFHKGTELLGDEENLDSKTGEPKTFLANIMVDLKTGEEKYVQNSYSIAKAIKTAKKLYLDNMNSVVFEIEFIGKTEVKGKPFNQFKIGACLEEDYEKINKS